MNPMPLVLDISSDEEPGLEEQPDFDWIKFLGMSDQESDDSDEVVVVGEVIPKRRSKCWKPIVKDVDDDDCVVLDGNPENGVASVNEEEEEIESDELQIVGETGQLACRDYPHARHLCASFPFSSTPHQEHCDRCHCYVCDSLAPCLKWGTGSSSGDHCHATDKVETWKIQRKNANLGMSSPLPASTNYVTSPCVAYPPQNQAAQLDIIRLYPNSMSQNQASRPITIRPCSTHVPIQQKQVCGPAIMRVQSDLSSQNYTTQNHMSRSNTFPVSSSNSTFTIPIGTDHGRNQELGSPLARNRYHSHAPNQSLGVRNNIIRRDRGRNAGHHLIHSHMVGKQAGSVKDAPTLDHSAHGSSGYDNRVNPAVQNDGFYGARGLSNGRNRSTWDTLISPNLMSPVEQNDRYHAAIGIPNDRDCYEGDAWTNPDFSVYSHLNSLQPNPGCVNENVVPSEVQTFGLPLSQPNNSQNFYQSCIPGNEAYPNYKLCLSSSQPGNEHRTGMQNEYATESIILCGNTSQDACQQKTLQENQSEIARKEEFSPFDLGWSENTNQSSETLVASSHLAYSVSIHQPLNIEESDMQRAGNINASTPDEFSTWFLEKNTVPGVADAAVPSELSNIPSPDHYPIDAAMLVYDF